MVDVRVRDKSEDEVKSVRQAREIPEHSELGKREPASSRICKQRPRLSSILLAMMKVCLGMAESLLGTGLLA